MIKNHHKNCKFMINFKFLWPRLESISIGNQLNNKFSIFRPKIMKLILFINLSLILNINFLIFMRFAHITCTHKAMDATCYP